MIPAEELVRLRGSVPADLAGQGDIPLSRFEFETTKADAFGRKWAERISSSGLAADQWAPVIRTDLARQQQGAAPLSDVEAAYALTASQGVATAPMPEPRVNIPLVPNYSAPEKILGRARQELGQIVRSLPQLPGTIIKEPLKVIAGAGGEAPEALDRATFGELLRALGPGQQLKVPAGVTARAGLLKVADFPGLRMIPGWGTALRVAAGKPGWKEIGEHPLGTALDVLPYASAGAKALLKPTLEAATVPGYLERMVASNPNLRSAWERPGQYLNAPVRTIVRAIDRAIDNGQVPHEVLGKMAENRVTWASMLERFQRYPGRRFLGGQDLTDLLVRKYNVVGREQFRSKVAQHMLDEKDIEQVLGMDEGSLSKDPKLHREVYDTITRSILARDDPDLLARVMAGKARVEPLSEPYLKLQTLIDSRLAELTRIGIDAGAYVVIDGQKMADAFARLGGRIELPDWLGRAPGETELPPWEIYSKDDAISGRYMKLLNNVQRDAARFEAGELSAEAAAAKVKAHTKAWDAFTRKMAVNPSVRYYPVIRQWVEAKTGMPLKEWVDEHQWLQDNPGPAGETAAEASERYRTAYTDMLEHERQAREGWINLKRMGIDPVFLHQVSPGKQVVEGRWPGLLSESVSTPSAFLKNTLRAHRPFFHNVQIAVNDFAVEVLKREAERVFVDGVEKAFQMPRAEVMNNLIDYWRSRGLDDERAALAAQRDMSPTGSYRTWAPEEFFAWRTPRAGKRTAEGEVSATEAAGQFVVHRRVQEMLKQLMPQGEILPVPKVYMKGMRAWRTSILPLNPNWNINNFVGGMVMLAAEAPGALKYLLDTRVRAVFKGEGGMALHPEISATAYRDLFKEGMGIEAEASRANFLNEVAEGQAAGKMLDALGRSLGRKVDWLYKLNEKVDAMFRSAAYLEGRDKALLAGMGQREAEEAGVRLANKVLQDWDAMTPVEQQIFKKFIPFYGWAKHILRYTFRYPFDHPLRAAFASNLAKIVIEGKDPTVADRFNFGMFKIGNLFGKARSLDVGAMNPFADTARFFSVAGLVGYLNPAFLGVLESMGVDTSSARADLYPGFAPEYDPQTGRIVAARPGFGEVVINFFPQAGAVSALAGWTEADRRFIEQNPEAAVPGIMRRLGMPLGVVPFPIRGAPAGLRQINLEEERVREAQNRAKAEVGALSAARGGSTRELRAFVPAEEVEPLVQFTAQLRAAAAAQRTQAPSLETILLMWRLGRQQQLANAYGLQ